MYSAEKVVYSAKIGDRDHISMSLTDCRYVVFADNGWLGPDSYVHGWDVLPATMHYTDPVRNAKIYKAVPHWFFDSTYSLWVDANFTVHADIDYLIACYLTDADIAVFSHSDRDCLYDEAEVCSVYYDKELIQPQIDRYRAEGYPTHNGLHACSIILRRHTPEVERFNELWWKEIQLGSRRDQISFDYCVWKTGIPIHTIPGLSRDNEMFTYRKHLRGI